MLIDLKKDVSPRALRWFAGLWFPALYVMVGVAGRDSHPRLAVVLLTAGLTLSLAGLVKPRLIKPVYTTLTYATYPIGFVLSYVLLAVIYFGIIMPVGLLLRLFYDPMQRAFEPRAQTYWIAREEAPLDRYFRQF